MAHLFGLVGKQAGERIPLESIKIQSNIKGFTAHVKATMMYKNHEDNPIEAIYIFPLDEQAAVCGFQATIDGRTIIAEIQEKQEARDTYDDAISSGQSAFLLEESDESSDIFQISVGNLPPKKEAVVELSFVTELTVEAEGRVVFVLPSVLNPRYSPSDSAPSISQSLGGRVATVSSPYSFDFEMQVTATSIIKEITSASHILKVEIDEEDKTEAKVTLAEAHKFDKDLKVNILTNEPFKPYAMVEYGLDQDAMENKETFLMRPVVMLNFFPEFKSFDSSEKGEFIFVVDRSGSMSGSRNNSARETLLLFLRSLPDGCYFNIVGFGSSYQTLFKKSELYNDKNLKAATQSAKSMQANLGGTEILRPLEWVFSQPLVKGHPRQLFLLTDGEVGNTQQVINLVQKHSKTARCFTFGIGAGVSTALVKGVARAGKGVAEFVSSEKERLQAKVIKTLKHALQPMVTDVMITWDLAHQWTVRQIPSAPPVIFSGERLVMFGLLKPTSKDGHKVSENTARLQGSLGHEGGKVNHVMKFTTGNTKPEDQNNRPTKLCLHRLAAKSFIQEQQDVYNESSQQLTEERRQETKEAIINFSKDANVVSKFTSFVAVDKHNHQPVSGPMKKRVVPLYEAERFGLYMPLASAEYCSMPLSSAPLRSRRSAIPKKKMIGSSLPIPRFAKTKSASPRKAMANVRMERSSPVQAELLFYSCEESDDNFSDDCYDTLQDAKGAPPPPPVGVDKTVSNILPAVCSLPPPPPPRPPSGGVDKPGPGQILEVISLQKASGAWDLTEQLMSLCGTNKDTATKGCPDKISVSKDKGKQLWATALALVILMTKFSSHKDEWEMIAEKGRKWMRKNLPAKVNFPDVLKAAANALGLVINDNI